MPTSSGATPPPANWPAAPVKGENKLSPKGGTRGATGSCDVPSEGACCVSLAASLLEGVPAEPPARVLKTSAVALATLAAAFAALWTVPTALSNAPAALVPRLDERRNASPTAGAAGTAAATKAAAGLLLVNVVSGPPSANGVIGAVTGSVAGSDTSPRTSAARPSEAAGSTCSAAAAGAGSETIRSGAGPAACPSSAAAGVAGAGAGAGARSWTISISSRMPREAVCTGSGSMTRSESVTGGREVLGTRPDSTSFSPPTPACGAGCSAGSGLGVEGAGSSGGDEGFSAGGGVSVSLLGGGGAFSTGSVWTGGVTAGCPWNAGGATGGVTDGVGVPLTGSATLPLPLPWPLAWPLGVFLPSAGPCWAAGEGCSFAQASLAARTKAERHKTSTTSRARDLRLCR